MLKAIHVLLIITFSIGEVPTNLEAASTVTKKPKGLPNIGNSCYLNSALQALYATHLQKTLSILVQRCPKLTTIGKALHDFFDEYSKTNADTLSADTLENLYGVLKSKKLVKEDRCEDDSLGFLVQLIVELNNELRNCSLQSPFQITFKISRRVLNEKDEITSVKDKLEDDIYIKATGQNMEDTLNKPFVGIPIINSEVPRTYRSRIFTKLPDILLIGMSPSADEIPFKNFPFPPYLSLSAYSEKNINFEEAQYTLKSISLYRKKAKHFTGGFSSFDGNWYFCNDSIIEEMPAKTMEEFQTQGFLIKDGQHYVPRVLLYERTIPYISRVSLLAQELSSLSEQLHTLVQEVLAQEK